ncbi:protease 4-like, partial [Trifolium medium]|nr:protease 4-like [Trifolium medium]
MVKASKKFKAIIIRIDSVGGDVHASQLMWEAVRSLASKKPVIASMSDVATSAGCDMAMGAGAIVAENFTLIGSIGVAHSGKYAELRELWLSFTPYEVTLDYGALPTPYEVDQMKKVAHGRIWTGKDAASHGLVDAIGGISCAVAIAKLKANIPQNRQVTLVELSRSGP